MIWTETKSFLNNKRLLDKALSFVEDELTKRYPKKVVSDHIGSRTCFILGDGTTIHVTAMNGEKFCDLVIEYADNLDQMKAYDTEDGDLFPVGDKEVFATNEDMLAAMLQEIQS